MKHLCTLVLIPLVFFLTVSFVLAAKPDSYPEVMFILDGSGSMWGKVGNETKIEAAKKVLHQVVPSIPEEVRVGLTMGTAERAIALTLKLCFLLEAQTGMPSFPCQTASLQRA